MRSLFVATSLLAAMSLAACGVSQNMSGSSVMADTQSKVIFNCKVTKLNSRVLESFGDDVTLEVFNPNVDHIQPNAFVKVVVVQDKLKLAFGERTYSNAKRYSVPADSQAAYTVESPDVEIGYLLIIDAFGSGEGSLGGYTTDLHPGERAGDRVENFADLQCTSTR